jgi:hypothetical protein
MESTIGGSGGFLGARGFAAGRFAAGLRGVAGLRLVLVFRADDAALDDGDRGLRAAAGFAFGDVRSGVESSSPADCAPVPGSGEESTVKPYQSVMCAHSSITKRQHQLISSQMSSLFR